MLSSIILVLSFVLLLVAALGVTVPRVNLAYLGLAAYVLWVLFNNVTI